MDVAIRTKRTYNLSDETVRKVRELVEGRQVAPSQDALVEMALREFFRVRQDAEEAQLWSAAATDPDLMAEAALLEAEFRTADRETWPE
jgi:predicted transcriptional regulator